MLPDRRGPEARAALPGPRGMPHTLHPTPYTLRPTPYTLHPMPYAPTVFHVLTVFYVPTVFPAVGPIGFSTTGLLVEASSGMECFLIDVVPKPAPLFRDRVVRPPLMPIDKGVSKSGNITRSSVIHAVVRLGFMLKMACPALSSALKALRYTTEYVMFQNEIPGVDTVP